MSDVEIEFGLNERTERVSVPARMTLADLLRERFGQTGTHLGCEHGVCGACTVLIDGRSVRACIMLAAQAQGHQITTIEGVSPADGGLSELQQSLSDHGGLQCGFCTPGFVLAAGELLANDPSPDEQAVREALSGNLCRCTGYEGIVQAILSRAEDRPRPEPAWNDLGPPPGGEGPDAPPVGAPRDRWDAVDASAPASESADVGEAAAHGETVDARERMADTPPDSRRRAPARRYVLGLAAGIALAAAVFALVRRRPGRRS